jgi:Flp pilus assembly protein TadB
MTVFGLLFGVAVGLGLALVLVPTATQTPLRILTNLVRVGRQVTISYTVRTHARDLSILGWSSSDLVARQLTGVVVGSLSVAIPVTLVSRGSFIILFVVVGGTVGFFVPSLVLRNRARHRRRTFVHAFSAYLDLVNVLLAGGAGIETALTAAADAGEGWAFSSLRTVVARARLLRNSVWSEFKSLSNRWGIDEVGEVAGSMSLSGEFGARIRSSLAVRADSMRSRQIAEVEAAAQSATERMGLPMMLLFVGFIALLGYPALQTVVMSM